MHQYMKSTRQSKRKPGRPKGQTAPRSQIAVRFLDDDLGRIDAYLERLREKVPGVQLTRADAIRSLVARGLGAEGHDA
jgi:hypothetical protein